MNTLHDAPTAPAELSIEEAILAAPAATVYAAYSSGHTTPAHWATLRAAVDAELLPFMLGDPMSLAGVQSVAVPRIANAVDGTYCEDLATLQGVVATLDEDANTAIMAVRSAEVDAAYALGLAVGLRMAGAR